MDAQMTTGKVWRKGTVVQHKQKRLTVRSPRFSDVLLLLIDFMHWFRSSAQHLICIDSSDPFELSDTYMCVF